MFTWFFQCLRQNLATHSSPASSQSVCTPWSHRKWRHKEAALLLPPARSIISFSLFPHVLSPCSSSTEQVCKHSAEEKANYEPKSQFPSLKRPPLFTINSLDSFSFDFGKVPRRRWEGTTFLKWSSLRGTFISPSGCGGCVVRWVLGELELVPEYTSLSTPWGEIASTVCSFLNLKWSISASHTHLES